MEDAQDFVDQFVIALNRIAAISGPFQSTIATIQLAISDVVSMELDELRAAGADLSKVHGAAQNAVRHITGLTSIFGDLEKQLVELDRRSERYGD